MERLSLNANERIKNSNEITTLIRQGQAFFLAPFKVYYSWNTQVAYPAVRFAVAVPKRKFGKAVHRNQLKRLSREGFRLQKHILNDCTKAKKAQLNILLMYQKSKAMPYAAIYQAIGDSLNVIIKEHG